MTEVAPTKPTVLVVDDSRLMRVAARKILKNDFEIIDAEDGEIAWDMLQSNQQVAVVMSDLSMPNLDGLGLLKKIRESNRTELRNLPVIIVTGAEDDDGSKATALAAGASDFITKPFESVQLLARANAQAKQQRTQLALQSSEASKQHLAQQSTLDPLTGLANKQSFLNSIQEHLAYAVRHRTELSLLTLRLDKYKIMFLRRGKQSAEELLCKIASVAKEGRRREDIVARIGMDTLGILLPSSNPIGAAKVGNQLQQAIAQREFSDAAPVQPFTISIGISALTTQRNLKAAEFLENALQALDGPKHSETAPLRSPDKQAIPSATNKAQSIVATAEEVLLALQTLKSGARPAQAADELARAVLPVLRFWNQSNDNRYQALIATLAQILDEAEQDARLAAQQQESSLHSL